MKFQYDRCFKFKLNEDAWEGYLVTAEELVEQYDEDDHVDNAAFVDLENKCLFISEGHVKKEIIGHELTHMFVESFKVNSANLDVDQFEEVFADFLGEDVDKFVKIRNKLYNRFKKFEGAGNDR